ncbi:hypothetical protein [Kribbella sp. NPDC051770]|uniref:hypothetical protein n=1 Tax=Kribbella sp. NPDC051770 TaxID=3155413 RepID=UPI00341482DD
MGGGDPVVPRDSAVHREFVRLYGVAQRIAPTAVDRWSGVLRATHTPPGELPRWGAFDPKSGDITLSAELVLPYLTGPGSGAAGPAQGQALATVLHEATHAGMEIDAPDDPNAVRTAESLGLIEAFAEYRAVEQFETFAVAAGYPDAYLVTPQYPGWYSAMDDLVRQVSGPAKDRAALLAEAIRGPGALHFDQLADSVVKNRLTHDVPANAIDQRAARAALIPAMTHRLWPALRHRPAESGLMVAGEIRQHLDAAVDAIRHYYRGAPDRPYPSSPSNLAAVHTEPLIAEGNKLAALPPPVARDRVDGPVRGGWVPTAGAASGRPVVEPVEGRPAVAPAGGQSAVGATSGGLGVAPAGARAAEVSGSAAGEGVGRGEVGGAAESDAMVPGKAASGGVEMRFLDGVAGAAGAVRKAPVLGQGARGVRAEGRQRGGEGRSGVER